MQQRAGAAAPARNAAPLRPVVPRCRPFVPVSRPCVQQHQTRERAAQLLVRAEEQPTSTPSHPFPEEEDFDLLSNRVAEIVNDIQPELRGCSIYLVGMMGSGKSTVRRSMTDG